MLPLPPVFNNNSSTVAEDWLKWELAWNAYKVATGINEKSQATQISKLITVIGAEARRVYHTAHFEADQRHEFEPDQRHEFEPVIHRYTEIMFALWQM